jgi:hypothetical protein
VHGDHAELVGAMTLRLPLWSAVLLMSLSARAAASAQSVSGAVANNRRWVHVDSVSGSLRALRTAVQRVLIAEGVGVRSVAACDCLIESGTMRLPRGESIQLFIHIVKAPTVVRGRISIEAIDLSSGQSNALVSAAVDTLLARVRRGIGVLRLEGGPR